MLWSDTHHFNNDFVASMNGCTVSSDSLIVLTEVIMPKFDTKSLEIGRPSIEGLMSGQSTILEACNLFWVWLIPKRKDGLEIASKTPIVCNCSKFVAKRGLLRLDSWGKLVSECRFVVRCCRAGTIHPRNLVLMRANAKLTTQTSTAVFVALALR